MGRDLTDPIAVLFIIGSDDAFFSLPCKDPLQRFGGVELCPRDLL
jgi:hypothetical protein